MSGEEGTVYPRRPLPRRPERPEDLREPSPMLLPVPPEDIGKVLQQILERLDLIEKRLESIEKMLMRRQSTA